jgi:hypothetical protein
MGTWKGPCFLCGEVEEGCINSGMYDRWEEYIYTILYGVASSQNMSPSQIRLILTAFLLALKSIYFCIKCVSRVKWPNSGASNSELQNEWGWTSTALPVVTVWCCIGAGTHCTYPWPRVWLFWLGKKKVKLSLWKAVEAHRIVRRRGSHIF